MRISDWSSDVCSSDLPTPPPNGSILNGRRGGRAGRCRRCFGKTETASNKQRRLGIERPDQPSSGTAREGERAALANARRHGDPVRLAHDRRIVAIGDDQPGTRRQTGIAIERARVEPRPPFPEKTVAILDILGPFYVPEPHAPPT